MSSNQYSFLFAAIVCILCSFFLTAAASGLKERQEFNMKLDQQKNILKALALLHPDQKYTSEEISSLYKKGVEEEWIAKDGQRQTSFQEGALPLYIRYEGNQIESYAVPVSGYGLWSTIYGYFALKGDGKTVSGFAVYKHGETPGLGGECEKEWFQKQFFGKLIVDAAGQFVSIGIVKGKVKELISSEKQDNFVDGISGSTVTSKGIETFLKEDLLKYESFSKKLREG